MRAARVIRFPTRAELVNAQPRTLRERLIADIEHLRERVRMFFRPKKAKVLRINNPAQWKLERARRKARGML